MNLTTSKFAVAAVAGLLLTSAVSFAEGPVRRINHPNGQPTFVANVPRTTTVGVMADGRGISGSQDAKVIRSEERRAPIHLGRGQTVYAGGEARR